MLIAELVRLRAEIDCAWRDSLRLAAQQPVRRSSPRAL